MPGLSDFSFDTLPDDNSLSLVSIERARLPRSALRSWLTQSSYQLYDVCLGRNGLNDQRPLPLIYVGVSLR